MSDIIAGRFELIDLIATGGAGAVWRARDLRHGRICAAKVLRHRDSADLLRFVRETGIALEHPHVLAPFGWAAEDAHVAIAMPLIAGGTLEQLVERSGPLGERAVVVLLDQLMQALAVVHAGGWVHRDVKPANVMLEPAPEGVLRTRLGDFGIAVHRTDVRFTNLGMVNGTTGFMAPELFDLAEPEPSHDVYAAGVTALMALNGRFRLQDGEIPADELDRRLDGVSEGLARVIRRMVATLPEERFRSADEVRAALRAVEGELRGADRELRGADGVLREAGGALRETGVAPHQAEAATHGFGATGSDRPLTHRDGAVMSVVPILGELPRGGAVGDLAGEHGPDVVGKRRRAAGEERDAAEERNRGGVAGRGATGAGGAAVVGSPDPHSSSAVGRSFEEIIQGAGGPRSGAEADADGAWGTRLSRSAAGLGLVGSAPVGEWADAGADADDPRWCGGGADERWERGDARWEPGTPEPRPSWWPRLRGAAVYAGTIGGGAVAGIFSGIGLGSAIQAILG